MDEGEIRDGGGGINVYIDGRRHRSRSYKGIEPVWCTDEDMRRKMTMGTQERIVVIEKSEGGKIRPVVKAGNDLFRRMDFLSDWIEGGLMGSELSTLFMGPKKQYHREEHTRRLVRDPNWWKVPLDQSAFDQNQSKVCVEGCFRFLCDWTSRTCSNKEYTKVGDAIETSLDMGIRVECGDKHWTWGNGMASGWR